MVDFIIFILCLIIFIFAFDFSRKHDKKLGIIGQYIGWYLAGFEDVEGDANHFVKFKIYKDKLIIRIPRNYKTIYFSEINNVGIKSEIQLQNDVTLGRLITFGLLSLGMKKQKTMVNNYVVIQYNVTSNIILKMQNNEMFVRQMNRYLGK